MKDKKVIFMGTPDFSVPVLEELIKNTNVVCVVTQPDKFVGRKSELKIPPVKEVALKNNIKVLQPIKIKEIYEELKIFNADIIVTCAYGQIIPKSILEMCSFGAINVHASLLPKYRGGAPIHKAIINGEEKTGITIMYMDLGMDTGDIIKQEKIKIEEDDNVGTLHDKLSILGANLLIKTLPSIFNKTNDRIKQDNSLSSFAPTIKRSDELINFNKSVRDVYNQIRGLYPFPCSYFLLDGKEIKVFSARKTMKKSINCGTINSVEKDNISIGTKDYDIEILKIKPSGKKEMLVKDFLNGKKEEDLINKKVG